MTIEEQEKIVLEHRSSGKMMKLWCSENRIDYKTLSNYSWQYNKQRGLCRKRGNSKTSVVELIPVKPKQSKLTIEIGNCRINVDHNTDLDLLRKVTMVIRTMIDLSTIDHIYLVKVLFLHSVGHSPIM